MTTEKNTAEQLNALNELLFSRFDPIEAIQRTAVEVNHETRYIAALVCKGRYITKSELSELKEKLYEVKIQAQKAILALAQAEELLSEY